MPVDLAPYLEYCSFKEMDQLLKKDKGSAFKLFKKHLSDLIEGSDFIVLDIREKMQIIDALRGQKRIYSSTVNLVLISSSGKDKLLKFSEETH